MKKLIIISILFAGFKVSAQWVSGGTQVSFTPDNHQRAFVSAAANKSVYITWSATDTTSLALSKVRLSSLDSTGALRAGWVSGGIVVSKPGDFYAPQLITSEDNGVIVAWYGYPAGNTYSDIYTQKYSSAGVALWNGGNPVKVSVGNKNYHQYPIIISDTKKGLFLTWNRYDSTRGPSTCDVMLQHIDSTGNVATGWNAATVGVATQVGVREYYPHLALTPDLSSVYVLYEQGLIGNTSLQLNKFNASNGNFAAGWNSTPVTLSSGPNVYPDILHDVFVYADNADNAVAFWIESRSSANGELYIQQVSPAGTQLLTANGVQLAGNTANGIDYLEVKQEADKNFLISFNNLDVFNDVAIMKVTPAGTVLFNVNPVTTSGKTAYPKAIPDGKKGAYVFYVNTNTPNKLYALGYDSTGILRSAWSLSGSNFGNINNYDGFNPNYDFNAAYTANSEAVVVWNKKATANLFTIFTCNLLPDATTCHNMITGIENYENENSSYVVYPNPFEEKIIIYNTQFNDEKYVLLKLFDVAGKLVYESVVNSVARQTIALSNLPVGFYTYQLCNTTAILQKGKLIKN
ncbi:MAG TPA: T9SS type A sorting domain-containing protein [Bacteroidia bacterium]|jgi:hypothetical protein|nr:T9SS type A sorting domain-containing protein [Bacteroidia bacterium]